MNRAGHPRVHQAHQLEVAGRRETYSVGLPRRGRGGADARRVIKAGSIGRRAWAPDKNASIDTSEGKSGWPCLAGFEECYGMDLTRAECQVDAVAGIDPKNGGEKNQGLGSRQSFGHSRGT